MSYTDSTLEKMREDGAHPALVQEFGQALDALRWGERDQPRLGWSKPEALIESAWSRNGVGLRLSVGEVRGRRGAEGFLWAVHTRVQKGCGAWDSWRLYHACPRHDSALAILATLGRTHGMDLARRSEGAA